MWKNRKMGDLSDFERGQIVGACLAGASVTDIVTLLGASRATVSEVMSTYTNHGKTRAAERNSGWKSTLTERDRRILRRILSKNHTTTAAELNILLEDSVSTKTVRRAFHKSSIHGRAVIAKPLITESNAQMRKRWCHDDKTCTSGKRKRARDMGRWVVLHAVPYIGKSLRLENTHGNLKSGMPRSNSDTRGRFCDGLGSDIVVQRSVGPSITLHGQITAREYVDRLGNQVHQVGFEPTIPQFERAKRVHALDRAAAVIGFYSNSLNNRVMKLWRKCRSGEDKRKNWRKRKRKHWKKGIVLLELISVFILWISICEYLLTRRVTVR
jgi:transposase